MNIREPLVVVALLCIQDLEQNNIPYPNDAERKFPVPSGDVERFVPSAAAAAAVLYSAGYAAPGLDFGERCDVASFPTSQR